MLVVADENARGVRRQRGLAGARQAEEHRRVGRVPDGVVGRAVHRHHALAGQQVVEDREHRFLVLAGIGGAADQHHLALEADGDDGLGPAAMPGGIGLEARHVDDGELGIEGRQLRPLGATQQVPDEQAVPGQLGADPDVQPIGRIGAAEQVLDEQFAAGEMRDHVHAQTLEGVGVHGLVVLPPDGGLDGGFADHELVLRRPPRVLAGGDEKRAAPADLALAPRHRLLHEAGVLQVVMGGLKASDPLGLKAPLGIEHASLHTYALLRSLPQTTLPRAVVAAASCGRNRNTPARRGAM